MNLALTIYVENTYEDGHSSINTQHVEIRRPTDEADLWDELLEFTGDSHGADHPKLGYCYEMTITDCADRPELVGLSEEWCGS